MTNPHVVAESSSQAECSGTKNEPAAATAQPGPALHGGSKVYKSGPLFLSSKGIGWTSWKKRWFILTQTSLVFYRSDPSAVPQKWSEVNLTLGGIDLNSSGSVVVKEEKKLITVLFSDGRDGRAFTLKAETLEDLHEWKAALEEALANAPNAALVGQKGIFRNDQSNGADVSSEQQKDRQTAKSLVVGRPILLALEDIDGTPSFLEKALRFLEGHGVKTEGILRQAADVEDVERRIQEYEKGKTEFSPEEDSHVIADCIKYVLRELPSSPVPASCCKALLEAYRTERSMRVNAMRSAICETFPEPNRRLLQRILQMMQTVASQKAVNRMSISAVAACMAPLLLRPLLNGECDIDRGDVGGDGSVQLLQAAAAANNAQAIVITLLEEYVNIFGDGASTHEPYTDSEESGSESEEITDDESFEEEDDEDYDDDDDDYENDDDQDDEDDGDGDGDGDDDDDGVTEDSESVVDKENYHESSPASSETGENRYSSKKVSGSCSSGSSLPKVDNIQETSKDLSSDPPSTSLLQHDSTKGTDSVPDSDDAKMQRSYSGPSDDDPVELSISQMSSELLHGHAHTRSARRAAVWGRTPAKKNLSMESIDVSFEEEDDIKKLECVKTDLETKVSNEAAANSLLQDKLEKRKQDLHERRLALEKDVARLQEQLKKEMDLRAALEAGLKISEVPTDISSLVDEKVKADLEEIAQAETDVGNLKKKSDDLEFQLNQQREHNSRTMHGRGNQLHQNSNHQMKLKEKQVDGRNASISSTSENSSRSKYENDKDKKQESLDAVHNPKGSLEAGASRPGVTGSRKRSEGSNATTFALSKLTNRLNFLKERRSQMQSDQQNMDRARNSTQPVQKSEPVTVSEHGQSVESSDNHQLSKGKSSKKTSELENNESHHNPSGQMPQNRDKGGKSEGPLNRDKGGKPEGPQNRDKGGKSEGPPNRDKGGKSEGPPNRDKGGKSEGPSDLDR